VPPAERRRRAIVLLACVAMTASSWALVISSVTGGRSTAAADGEGESAREGGRAGGDPERRAAGVTDLVRTVEAEMARPWPALQSRDGRFRNMFGGGTRYGEAVLGYALLNAGERAGDRTQVSAGINALDYAVRRSGERSRPSVFENLAVASAYNLARRRMGGSPQFRRSRPAWERFLRGRQTKELLTGHPYDNHYLADAVVVLELMRSGLRSDDPGTILGGRRAAAATAARRLINVEIPERAARSGTEPGGRRAMVLSDPPDNPLAYHGLSLGLYARAIDLLGSAASSDARRTLSEVARASLHLTGPDGDGSYTGRSQEQAWALGATAYGAAAAARLPDTRGREAADLRALAERALTRLMRSYGSDRDGLRITPSVRKAGVAGRKGLEDGAEVPSFTGLTLMMVNWAAPELRRAPARPGGLPADRPGGALLSEAQSRFAVARTGDAWLAVKQAPGPGRRDDLRNDFGLVALKVLGAGGAWLDLVPARPKTIGRPDSPQGPPDSAGPVLRTNGTVAFPVGSETRIDENGTITVRGGYRSAAGALLRSDVDFVFAPVRRGVRMTLPRQAGDRLEYSAFLPDGPPLTRRPRAVEGAGVRLAYDSPARVRLERGYASASDARLVRVRLSFGRGARPVHLKLTAAG